VVAGVLETIVAGVTVPNVQLSIEHKKDKNEIFFDLNCEGAVIRELCEMEM
jgi:hypothetical protein